MGYGNSYQAKHDSSTYTAGWLAQYRTFGGTKLAIDGGYRVRTESFTIRNIDTTGFSMGFSFDGTNYTTLNYYDTFSQKISADRYYFKSDQTDARVAFEVIASLKSDW